MKSWGSVTLLCALAAHAWGQNEIRAWYAQGQVWVIFEMGMTAQKEKLDQSVYTLYASETPFEYPEDGEVRARLFSQELVPSALRNQMNLPSLTFSVPTPDGNTYQLRSGEGLFVLTPHSAGNLHLAVDKNAAYTNRTRRKLTSIKVPVKYLPTDRVQCHLQYKTKLEGGYTIKAYYMWADGQQDWWNGRPDFPVMANMFKNGMPSMFLVSVPTTTNNQQKPITHWLHDDFDGAIQSLPNRKKSLNISPASGILVSHNDDCFRYIDSNLVTDHSHTGFFGWPKHLNPFSKDQVAPMSNDTIINYTQKRILWINDWVIKKYNGDPNRVAIQGHRMGAFGASALARAYPETFSSAALFNYNLTVAPESSEVQYQNLLGYSQQNLPTNLKDGFGQTVHVDRLVKSTATISKSRDMSIMQVWHGINDLKGPMAWGKEFVDQIIKSDSMGLGWQIYWDERSAAINSIESYWIKGMHNTDQTFRDDVAFHEQFKSNQSYPAFFNHRLDKRNNQPGATNPLRSNDWDSWGTWGGYHNWDLTNLVDEPDFWETSIWLTGYAVYNNDNCPHAALTSDIAIRKPNQFIHEPGDSLNWRITDEWTGKILEEGRIAVNPDGLVVIPQVTIYREDFGKLKLQVFTETLVSTEQHPFEVVEVNVFPNPTSDVVTIDLTELPSSTNTTLSLHNSAGMPVHQQKVIGHEQRIELNLSHLPAGQYYLSITGKSHQYQEKLVIIH